MDEAGPVLAAALDAGINFFDNARAYTDSEAKFGRYLSPRRREFYMATKSMARDKAGMAKDIDISLATMNTDYIDIYQVHHLRRREDLDRVMAPGGALEALKDAQAAGKIGHIGVTGHNIDLLVEAISSNEFSTVQVPFNCIETKALEVLFAAQDFTPLTRLSVKNWRQKQIASGRTSVGAVATACHALSALIFRRPSFSICNTTAMACRSPFLSGMRRCR